MSMLQVRVVLRWPPQTRVMGLVCAHELFYKPHPQLHYLIPYTLVFSQCSGQTLL